MKNKSLLFIFSLLIALLFISCDGDIKISIYTRDLDDVMKSKEEVIYTNVNLIVESLQDENDIAFLRNCLNGFSNEHPVEYNYSTSLSFDIKIPIVTEGTELDYSKDLLILSGKYFFIVSTKFFSGICISSLLILEKISQSIISILLFFNQAICLSL